MGRSAYIASALGIDGSAATGMHMTTGCGRRSRQGVQRRRRRVRPPDGPFYAARWSIGASAPRLCAGQLCRSACTSGGQDGRGAVGDSAPQAVQGNVFWIWALTPWRIRRRAPVGGTSECRHHGPTSGRDQRSLAVGWSEGRLPRIFLQDPNLPVIWGPLSHSLCPLPPVYRQGVEGGHTGWCRYVPSVVGDVRGWRDLG